MIQNTVINDTIKELNKLIKEKALIPFLGAGFSANIPGYPTWDKFIYKLNKVLELDCRINIDLAKVFNNNWMEATEFFYYQKGKLNNDDNNDIYRAGKRAFLKEISRFFENINEYNDNNWEQHELIVKKFNTIFTTNWDSTIEKAAIRNNIGGKRILADINSTEKLHEEYFLKNGSNNLNIFYYHGTYICEDAHIDSVVASEKDYYTRLKHLERHPIDKRLESILNNKNLLFIGYSLNDINVAYFLNQINQLRVNGEAESKAFFILLKTPEEINSDKFIFYKKYKTMVTIPILIKEDVNTMEHSLTYIKTNDLKPYSDTPGKLFCELCNNNFITQKGMTSRFVEFLNFDSLSNVISNKKVELRNYLLNISNKNEEIKREFYRTSLINFLNKL